VDVLAEMVTLTKVVKLQGFLAATWLGSFFPQKKKTEKTTLVGRALSIGKTIIVLGVALGL